MKVDSELGTQNLFCSLGTSWPVVPEAVLSLGERCGEVEVLTTDGGEIPVEALLEAMPGRLRITRVARLLDITSPEQHRYFEEVLFRWYLAGMRRSGKLPWVCLAGGRKGMVAAFQKAASVFGAEEVFHLHVEPHPTTMEEIRKAQEEGRLRRITLGPEPGLERLRVLSAERYGLILTPLRSDGAVVRAELPKLEPDAEFALSERVSAHLSSLIHLDRAEELDLPFAFLGRLSDADLNWLRQPLDGVGDREWVKTLPKVELHCHLGGFATHGEELCSVRAAAGLKPEPGVAFPAGWPRPEQPVGLEVYRHLGDANGSQLLVYPEALAQQITLLYRALQADRVIYAEIRCSPAKYASEGRSGWEVLQQIVEGFSNEMQRAVVAGEFVTEVRLLIIATRTREGDRSELNRHVAMAVTAADAWRKGSGCRVVGLDLAGGEAKETRAEFFTGDFLPAHRCGLAVTAHAGENDDEEGIWQAVFHLHARRLGHALHLLKASDLLRTVADRGIAVEMCPFANYQICGFRPMIGNYAEYPLREYLRAGVRVTVNSDNLGISGATLSENLLLLAELCPGITRMEILQLQANAISAAFASAEERRRMVGRMKDEG